MSKNQSKHNRFSYNLDEDRRPSKKEERRKRSHKVQLRQLSGGRFSPDELENIEFTN